MSYCFLLIYTHIQGRSQKLFGCTHELASSFIGVYLNDLCAYESEYEASAASRI